MDKFICVRTKELSDELISNGARLMYEQYINGEKIYVFLNTPVVIENYSLSKEQFFTTNELFF